MYITWIKIYKQVSANTFPNKISAISTDVLLENMASKSIQTDKENLISSNRVINFGDYNLSLSDNYVLILPIYEYRTVNNVSTHFIWSICKIFPVLAVNVSQIVSLYGNYTLTQKRVDESQLYFTFRNI